VIQEDDKEYNPTQTYCPHINAETMDGDEIRILCPWELVLFGGETEIKKCGNYILL
jgi:hypothetical protein